MENIKPKYSVIIPLYNKAPYIRKALESVMSQTYTDIECIIVNDGSSDNSLEVVQNFVNGLKIEDRRLKIVEQVNAGVAAARNRGVKESKGKYVCFLDADDWWEPEFLEEIDKLIKDYPDAGLYATNYVYYKPGKTRVMLDIPSGYINYPTEYFRTGAMPVTSITTSMPRKVFDEMGGFPIGIKLGEDFLLWAKTAVHYKVAFCKKALAYYNNDVPASLRATRNLHEPKQHMLFNLQPIEAEIEKTLKIEDRRLKNDVRKEEWKALLDKLRVGGLMDYWLDSRYHEAAAKELQKVDWSMQPKSAVRQYKNPICILKAKRRFMQVGSYIKQKIIKAISNQ